jgi:hypothetical protein
MSTEAGRAPTRGEPDGRPATIVVGYDGSDEAREAVAVAAEHAGRDGTVVAVHVRPPVVVVPRRAVRAARAAA